MKDRALCSVLAVAGFSFWFFIAVPFASHRESYVWMTLVWRGSFLDVLSLTATTWRPLAQTATWLGFRLLDPTIFPTSVLRQTLLQGSIFGMFVLAWVIITRAAPQPRVFAIVAFVAGGVFFPAYIHLFHIYGVFYVPILLIVAGMLKFLSAEGHVRKDVMVTPAVAAIALLLVLWHPFATALFLAFYFGRYLECFKLLGPRRQTEAWTVLLAGSLATLIVLLLSFRIKQTSLYDNPFGFLITYRTNEVSLAASLVAWLLAYVAVVSTNRPPRRLLIPIVGVTVAGIYFVSHDVPLLLLWILVVLGKLLFLQEWSLFVPLLVATLLPYGGGIGGPVYGLFPIIIATYGTAWQWRLAEKTLSSIDNGYLITLITILVLIAIAVRMDVSVPVVSAQAKRLLAERERTYQLEHVLSWLRASRFCGADLAFAENSGNPVDSVESAIIRRYRPPAALYDVGTFWDAALRCRARRTSGESNGVAIITFGGQELPGATPIFELPGKHAGAATVWVPTR